MLLSKRSVLGLVAVTSILAGCDATTVVQRGGSDTAQPSGPARTLSFARPESDASSHRVRLLRTLDFDGDGHLDIAVTGSWGYVGLRRNAGDGTFDDIVWQKEPTDAIDDTVLAVGDLNGDGLDDLVFSTPAREVFDGGIYVILGSADAKVGAPVRLTQSSTKYSSGPLHVADMNGDGVPDIIQCESGRVSITPVTSAMTTARSTTTTPDAYGRCAAGDFNGDGWMDLVTAESGQTIGVSLTDDSGKRPKLSTLYPSKKESLMQTGLFAADVNGDGRSDAVALFSGNMLVYLAEANGSLADPIVSEGNLYTGHYRDKGTSARFADMNGDGKLDALMVHGGGGAHDDIVEIMLGDGTGKFTQVSLDLGLLGGGPASDIAVGDFDGDGLPDLAVAYGDRTYMLRNTSR